MRILRKTGLAMIMMLLCGIMVSCVEEEEYSNDAQGNFEALWRIIDEHYCFFDYKKSTLGLDWNEVHARYAPMFNDGMTTTQHGAGRFSPSLSYAMKSTTNV